MSSASRRSIGISLYPDDGEDVDTLVAEPMRPCTTTKRQRSGSIAFYGKAPVEAPRLHAQPDSPAHQTLARAASEVAEQSAGMRNCARRTRSWCWPRSARRSCRPPQSGRGSARRALLAVVAQELRNPLAPMRIASAMLGFAANRRPAAAARAADHRAAADAHVAPGSATWSMPSTWRPADCSSTTRGRPGPGHRRGRRCKPTDDGRTRAAVRLALAARRHRSAG